MMTRAGRSSGLRGLDPLKRRLARLRRSVDEQAGKAVAETAEEVRDQAQDTLRRAPGGLPRLADGVEVQGEGRKHRVAVRHPAAPFVEFGTRHRPPCPFLQPAADAARPGFRKRMKTKIARLLRRGA